MRIVLHAEGRTLRGNERQLLLLVDGLRARGHELFVSCRRNSEVGRAFAAAGARVTGARPRGDFDVVSALAFAHWLRRVRPAGVLLSSWKRLPTAAAAARIAGVGPIVVRVGGVHAVGRRHRYALARLVDWVYVNSAAVREHLLAAVPQLDPGRVVLIPNALETEPVEPVSLRSLLSLPADAHVLFAAGGLERRKGHDIAIAALSRLPDDVHLAIAGEGPERAALAAQARSLGVTGRVHLLGQRDDVPALLRGADTYVLPSRAEGMAVGLMEAMAAGCPAVACDVGGVAELLGERAGDGPAGWIVPRDDAAALAAAIRAATGEEAVARARSAGRRIREEYTPARLVARVESLLRGGRPRGTNS